MTAAMQQRPGDRLMVRRARRVWKARAILGGIMLGIGMLAALPGCNMVKGIGQDITAAAEQTEAFFSE